MSTPLLYLWEISVTLGFFGFGIAGLRVLGFRSRVPLALSGVFGVSVWIALGGVLNLLHLWRPAVFFAMAAVGAVLLLFYAWRGMRSPHSTEVLPSPPWPLPAKMVLGAAILLIGTMMASGIQPTIWNWDDLQGYVALAIKALQNHAIQPDPFCERRVQTGVGGNNFLDSLMFAGGDLRAMQFVDSTFGLFVYALGLWTIARKWKLTPMGTAVALLALPFATLIKVNLTIIYLSAAGFLAVLLLLTDWREEERLKANRVVALGVIVGAMCTTKSPNLVFIVIYLSAVAVLYKLLQPRARIVLPLGLSLLVALAVFAPYSLVNKTNGGTYLYPLLGRGFHLTAYHVIADPSHFGMLANLVVQLAPNVLFLSVAIVVAWRLTRDWDSGQRVCALAFLCAALLTAPITTYGLGGEAADRYTAPFVMPAVLVFLLIVWSAKGAGRYWRWAGGVALVCAASYIIGFLGFGLMWYRDIKMLAYEAINRRPPHYNSYQAYRNRAQIADNLAYGARIQAAIPPGATAIEDMLETYMFDFHRNRIYIQDYAGMSSPPPGIPLPGSVQEMRQYLVQQGVGYIIFDLRTRCSQADQLDLLLHGKPPSYGWWFLLSHETFAHSYVPWSRVEAVVPCHTRNQLQTIVEQTPHVFDDGQVVVARID